MIEHLVKIGRFNSAIVITAIAVTAPLPHTPAPA